jgi:hypothetical protein
MPSADKQKRIAIISVVAALVVAGTFWALVIPRIMRYLAPQETRNTELEEVLHSIDPPAETRLIKIKTVEKHGIPVVVGTYSTDLDCESVKAHYKQEFPKHGFSYANENQYVEPGRVGMDLSSPEYFSTLICNVVSRPPTSYVISLDRKHSRD